MSRFLKYFLYLFGYMVVWAVIMLPVILLMKSTYGDQAHQTVMAVLGFLVPFMQRAAKRIFVYPGEGVPVSEEKLRRLIRGGFFVASA